MFSGTCQQHSCAPFNCWQQLLQQQPSKTCHVSCSCPCAILLLLLLLARLRQQLLLLACWAAPAAASVHCCCCCWWCERLWLSLDCLALLKHGIRACEEQVSAVLLEPARDGGALQQTGQVAQADSMIKDCLSKNETSSPHIRVDNNTPQCVGSRQRCKVTAAGVGPAHDEQGLHNDTVTLQQCTGSCSMLCRAQSRIRTKRYHTVQLPLTTTTHVPARATPAGGSPQNLCLLLQTAAPKS